MTNISRTSCRVGRWSTGAGLAAAAAVIALGAAPAARADDGSLPTDIGLLNSAETNVLDGFNLTGHTDTVFPDVIGKVEAIQTPLLSSDNSFVSGVGEALFNGPDQQLAQASDTFLSAAQAVAADPTSITALGDYASAGFQLDGSIFGLIPSAVIGKLTDQIFDIGGFDTPGASAATDLATTATSASATPDDVIGQAIGDLNQGVILLDAAPTADLSAKQADTLAETVTLSQQLDGVLGQFASAQDGLSAADQSFLGNADEQFVSAAQNFLAADQAFVAADQAGDLSSSSFTSVDLGLIQADLGFLPAAFTVGGESIFAAFDPNIGAESAATTFTELLSSIGL